MTIKTNRVIKYLALTTVLLSIASHIHAENIATASNTQSAINTDSTANAESTANTKSTTSAENATNIENTQTSEVTPIAMQGLDILLNEKEQSLFNAMEQRHQAESLINLMNTFKRLADYPEEAINQLLGDGPNQQVLKGVIRSLKAEEQAKKNATLAARQPQKDCPPPAPQNKQAQVQQPQPPQKVVQQPKAPKIAKPKKVKPPTEKLIPVFAVAKSSNGVTEGKVIFRTSVKGNVIPVSEGHQFSHHNQQYQLLAVRPHPSANGKFRISLKTPSKTKHYSWPK
jgi:hypothetical protein